MRETGSSQRSSARPIRKLSLLVRLLRPLGYTWLWAARIRVVGDMPDAAKFVIVAAPHRTNWDLPHVLAAGLHYGIYIQWLGKASIFNWPFGGLMRRLGGISVDRSSRNNAVDTIVATFNEADRMVLAIPPEGTRAEVTAWKTGFYHIAVGAKVPLVLCFVDYQRREIGVASVFDPCGDYEVDLPKIMAVYEALLRRPQ